jgi:hypothetical protein
MKKILPIILILFLFGSGCSSLAPFLEFVYTPTVTLAPTETFTPAPTVTKLPTQDLFATATYTPTSLGHTEPPTVDPSQPTGVPTPFPTFERPPDSPDGYYTPKDGGFVSVLISGNVFYWNAGPCWPREIKFTAIVTDPLTTDKVLLFMRLREKKNTLNFTDWGGGAIMTKEENGSFTYNLTPKNVSKYYLFKNAWLEYQLVAINEEKLVIGRTVVNDRTISLVRCQPVP